MFFSSARAFFYLAERKGIENPIGLIRTCSQVLGPKQALRHISEAAAAGAGRREGEGGEGLVGTHRDLVAGVAFLELLGRRDSKVEMMHILYNTHIYIYIPYIQ